MEIIARDLMYQVLFEGEVIGHSRLEGGDPPMGAAFGTFVPAPPFAAFRRTATPEKDNDAEIVRWLGLSISTADGLPVECHGGVVLFEYDLGDDIEYEVDAIGIDAGEYERLFPDHVRDYEIQFL